MYTYKGNTINANLHFTLEGKQYPSNWLSLATPDDLTAAGITYTPAPAKTLAEIKAEQDRETSNQAKANLAKLRADIFPYVLAMLAAMPGSTKVITDAAVLAMSERAKLQP